MHDLSGPGVIEWLGFRYKTILSAAGSGGSISVVDTISPPASGPPRHIHDREDETFILLTGTCEFWLDGQGFTKAAGETVFVPRGREHTFRVTGSEPSRQILILSPGGFEDFFAEMAAGQFRIPEDMESINASAARHSLRFTGPPLGAE
ncbi:MAG: cupin domain-containing protein [Pseudomonadota bacterium]